MVKNVLDIYSSKNDINIKQIVAYKDNILEIAEYRDGFKKDDTMNVMSVTKSVTSLLIGIAIGMNVLDFANEYLFKPLGIAARINAGCESKEDQFEYLMNRNDHGKVWLLDPTGMPTAGWGLSLSAYEMAQIGLMVLNNGVYNNTRIVSEDWIEMMTRSYISTDEKFGNQDYGFLWWLPHRTREVIAAIGDGGNIIYIDRKNQIVVAITAYFKPMVFDRVEYIEKNIVEALTKS